MLDVLLECIFCIFLCGLKDKVCCCCRAQHNTLLQKVTILFLMRLALLFIFIESEGIMTKLWTQRLFTKRRVNL